MRRERGSITRMWECRKGEKEEGEMVGRKRRRRR